MRQAVAVAALAMLMLAGTAHAQRYSGVDGNRLLGICTNKNVGIRRTCESYVAGVSDTITLYQEIAPKSEGKMKVPAAICVPPSTTGVQLQEAVVTWLRAHQADRGRPAVAIVYRVLHDRFGCK